MDRVPKHLLALHGRNDQEQLLLQVLATVTPGSDKASVVLLARRASNLTLSFDHRAAVYCPGQAGGARVGDTASAFFYKKSSAFTCWRKRMGRGRKARVCVCSCARMCGGAVLTAVSPLKFTEVSC